MGLTLPGGPSCLWGSNPPLQLCEASRRRALPRTLGTHVGGELGTGTTVWRWPVIWGRKEACSKVGTVLDVKEP